jgi:hypothetical protein
MFLLEQVVDQVVVLEVVLLQVEGLLLRATLQR